MAQELKAISGHEIRENIDYNTRGVDPEDKEWRNYGKELCDTQYYLKSEADAVIAELEEKLKVQTSIAEEGWKESGTYHTSYAEAVKELYEKNKELRRHKYKRCLAMARYYENEVRDSKNYMSRCQGGYNSYVNAHIDKMTKRMKKWLELAEKFKEAK